jgi:hypothetical protein
MPGADGREMSMYHSDMTAEARGWCVPLEMQDWLLGGCRWDTFVASG